MRLDWDGKPTQVERHSLPFQTVEVVNESRATRDRDVGSLLQGPARAEDDRNQLIWGDNKLVMSSLLPDYAGAVDLVYIDPPFDTGTDFSFRVSVGPTEVTKLPSLLEEHAYRDTWGHGRSSYLTMIYERLVLVHELLSTSGSFYLHCAPNVSHYLKLICDEIFGTESFRSEIVWKRSSAHSDVGQGRRQYGNIHDVLLYYTKGAAWTWDTQYTSYDPSYVEAKYRSVEAETGRRYQLDNLTAPGGGVEGQPFV